jgi:hypothetical protein
VGSFSFLILIATDSEYAQYPLATSRRLWAEVGTVNERK